MFAETGCDLGAPGLWHDAGDVALEQLSGVDAYNAIHDRVDRLLEEGIACSASAATILFPIPL